jgi:hypothetical protein
VSVRYSPGMLYAILCYNSEQDVGAWSKAQDDEVMAKLGVVEQKLAGEKRLGPVARLQPTRAAKTLRKGRESFVTDGPFAETKEQLLGFFVVECESFEHALATARELGEGNPTGSYEVRPVNVFRPGVLA